MRLSSLHLITSPPSLYCTTPSWYWWHQITIHGPGVPIWACHTTAYVLSVTDKTASPSGILNTPSNRHVKTKGLYGNLLVCVCRSKRCSASPYHCASKHTKRRSEITDYRQRPTITKPICLETQFAWCNDDVKLQVCEPLRLTHSAFTSDDIHCSQTHSTSLALKIIRSPTAI